MIRWAFPCALALLLSGCARQAELPVLGEIPNFQLTAQDGSAFDSQRLTGHVWVANFIYTTCVGPCPMMTTRMRRLQDATKSTPGVLMVSFTVDPAHDTPPVLAEYASRYKQDPSRWFFLTGEMEKLNDLGLHSFKLNPVDGNLEHSIRFVVVDRQRRIRGFYLSDEDGFQERLTADVVRLEKAS